MLKLSKRKEKDEVNDVDDCANLNLDEIKQKRLRTKQKIGIISIIIAAVFKSCSQYSLLANGFRRGKSSYW